MSSIVAAAVPHGLPTQPGRLNPKWLHGHLQEDRPSALSRSWICWAMNEHKGLPGLV
jgi:hypothetical protein